MGPRPAAKNRPLTKSDPTNPFPSPLPVLLKKLGKSKKKNRPSAKQCKQKAADTVHHKKQDVVNQAASNEVPPSTIEPSITWTMSQDEETSHSSSASPQSTTSTLQADTDKSKKIALIEEGLYTKSEPNSKDLEAIVAKAIESSPAIASLKAVIKHNGQMYKLQLGLKDDVISMHESVNKELRNQFSNTLAELRTRHNFEMFDLELQLLDTETNLEEKTEELEKVSSALLQTQHELYEKEILAASFTLPWSLLSPRNASSPPSNKISTKTWGESAEC